MRVLLLVAAPAWAASDPLTIESLSIFSRSHLGLTHANISFFDQTRTAENTNALLPPVAVAATVADPWGLSFSNALQTNGGFYRTQVSVVNAYPPEATDFHPADLVRAEARSEVAYSLSVGSLVPDTPLDMTLHIFGGHLEMGNYYERGDGNTKLTMQLQVGMDGGPLSTVWQWQTGLVLNDLVYGSGWYFPTYPLVDAQGIGQPPMSLSTHWEFFASSGRIDIFDFERDLHFGLLQPGHTFQLAFATVLEGEGRFEFHGPNSGFDLDLIDPLSLGGNPAQGPLSLAGLTLPSPVPEPQPAVLALPGLALLLARWRRAGPRSQPATAPAA